MNSGRVRTQTNDLASLNKDLKTTPRDSFLTSMFSISLNNLQNTLSILLHTRFGIIYSRVRYLISSKLIEISLI